MIGIAPLRWLLTVAFGGAAAFHLLRCLRPPAARLCPVAEDRLSEMLHLVMGLSMIAMIWRWGAAVPAAAWIAIFMMSTAWFAVRAVRTPRGRALPVFFATATGTMVWMSASAPGDASAVGHSGMDMAGMAHAPVGCAGWASALLGGYLVLAAFWWVGRGMRIGGLSTATTNAVACPLDWSALCHGVMSAGMGIALLAMA
ncbi:hypothetical protein GA0070624_3424 [Micromonospora rhizosphaerae]|uniref:DUF5134 domain-containing protein n=1 Tax=Micromonospora rhizosphaerae TaxID=568872 RepID=A0A1C6SCP5_9ACTN|nr:DUF5134 domain-containing protein [Micromonospora rhizosphaerae]SCL27054.1 hypothetical protein GA0070624_3424 [Micromonospora rhizosphaerae]